MNRSMRSTSFVLLALFWGCALLVASQFACTSWRAQQFELSEAEEKRLQELQAETEVGRSMAGRLLAYYGNAESEDLLCYINRVGRYVASYGDFPDRRYLFEVIDSDIVNAFACPGGYILITKGALRHAKSEAELAAILGHEAVHVGYKHMFEALKKMDDDEMEKTAADAASNTSMPESVMVRKRPEPEVNAANTMLARYMSGASAGLSVMRAARAGMSLILEKGLGAEKEYEADREGVKYAIRAGYDPDAMEDFLCRLQKKKVGAKHKGRKCKLQIKKMAKMKAKSTTILDRTHPPTVERVRNIRQSLAELNADEIIGAVGQKRFETYQEELGPPDDKDQS